MLHHNVLIVFTVTLLDLGCAFLTERCVNESVYPYLCDASSDEVMCTYDHLSKVLSLWISMIMYHAHLLLRVLALLVGLVLMTVLFYLLMNQNIFVVLNWM